MRSAGAPDLSRARPLEFHEAQQPQGIREALSVGGSRYAGEAAPALGISASVLAIALG